MLPHDSITMRLSRVLAPTAKPSTTTGDKSTAVNSNKLSCTIHKSVTNDRSCWHHTIVAVNKRSSIVGMEPTQSPLLELLSCRALKPSQCTDCTRLDETHNQNQIQNECWSENKRTRSTVDSTPSTSSSVLSSLTSLITFKHLNPVGFDSHGRSSGCRSRSNHREDRVSHTNKVRDCGAKNGVAMKTFDCLWFLRFQRQPTTTTKSTLSPPSFTWLMMFVAFLSLLLPPLVPAEQIFRVDPLGKWMQFYF